MLIACMKQSDGQCRLLDPDSRIPFSQLVELYEKAAHLTGDSDFDFIWVRLQISGFDVLGYAALNSATLAPLSSAWRVIIQFGQMGEPLRWSGPTPAPLCIDM